MMVNLTLFLDTDAEVDVDVTYCLCGITIPHGLVGTVLTLPCNSKAHIELLEDAEWIADRNSRQIVYCFSTNLSA